MKSTIGNTAARTNPPRVSGGEDRESSMRAVPRRLAAAVVAIALTAAGIAALTLAAAASAAATRSRDVTVTIKGIGRFGQAVTIPDNQTGLWRLSGSDNGPTFANIHGVYHVPAGEYLVGGYVPVRSDPASGNTLVVQRVDIRSSSVITLDSRGGKPVSVALTGVTAVQQSMSAGVCVGGGSGSRAWSLDFLQSYQAPGGSNYVKPLAAKDLSFIYQSSFIGQDGAVYDLAGIHRGGLPANAAFSQSAASLARITIGARAGTVPGDSSQGFLAWQVSAGGDCATQWFMPSPAVLPWRASQQVTPGQWNVDELSVNLNPPYSFADTVHALSGREYTTTFNNAVAGPTTGVPVLASGVLCSEPDVIYGDPAATGWQQDGTGTVTLLRSGRVVGRRGLGRPCFRLGHRTGWYTMQETAVHAKPVTGIQPATLSTKITLSWRFRVPFLTEPYYDLERQMPAVLATFAPAGLSAQNQALGGGTTTIVLRVIRNGGYGATVIPRYRLRAVRVQFSLNDGATWQSVPVTARHGYWVLKVADPPSGFVSLRSTVTDVNGNSSTETIYRSYAIG
jgi:hypothetical protein